MLFSFYAVDPKCSSSQAQNLICFNGDCHVVAVQLRLQEKQYQGPPQANINKLSFIKFDERFHSCIVTILEFTHIIHRLFWQ